MIVAYFMRKHESPVDNVLWVTLDVRQSAVLQPIGLRHGTKLSLKIGTSELVLQGKTEKEVHGKDLEVHHLDREVRAAFAGLKEPQRNGNAVNKDL